MQVTRSRGPLFATALLLFFWVGCGAVDAGPDAGRVCVSDCQCGPGEACDGQHCFFLTPQFPVVCNDPGADAAVLSCACGHGTCELDSFSGKGCCVGADGHIAGDLTDPVCLP